MTAAPVSANIPRGDVADRPSSEPRAQEEPMPDTAGAADTPVVGVDVGTLSGRADAVRDRRGAGTGGVALTEPLGAGPTTPAREGHEG